MDVCKEGSVLFVYADDAKLFSYIINSAKDVITLQNDFNVMNNWIKEWSLNLNIGKCRIVSYGRRSSITKYDYFIGNEIIERTESITDLGVVFDSVLSIISFPIKLSYLIMLDLLPYDTIRHLPIYLDLATTL